MKLIVFGATGSVGLPLIKQALEKGHTVTAFTRSPEKLIAFPSPRLTVFKGDVFHAKDVLHAMPQHDAVLCVLGDGSTGKVRAAGTKNIVNAMQQHNVQRLICQTTLGMGESRGNLNFFWKHIMFGLLLKKAYRDHQLQEQYVKASGLDYTLIRPSALTDGNLTLNYHFGFDQHFTNLALKISRNDVADFMLRQLTSNEYIKKAVSISH